MRAPHIFRLAEVDEQRFIAACRSGVVHLTWGRTTTRLNTHEFRRLSWLLAQATEASSPLSLQDGQMHVTCRQDDDCEFRLGPLVLLLSPAEFDELGQMVRAAARRLEEILASGVWDEDEPEEAPLSPLEQLRQHPFSEN